MDLSDIAFLKDYVHCFFKHTSVVAENETSLSLTPSLRRTSSRVVFLWESNSDRRNGSVAFKVEPVIIKAWFCMKNVALKKLSVASRAKHLCYDGILCDQMYACISDSSDLGYQMF